VLNYITNVHIYVKCTWCNLIFLFKIYKIDLMSDHQSIFQTVFLFYPESLWNAFNKSLYSDNCRPSGMLTFINK